MKKRILLSMVLCTAAVLTLATLGFAADTLKIGVVDTYSGGAALQGIDNLNGFKMAVDEINAKGGVLGKKIEIVTRDDKFNPSVGLSMAKELVLKEDVQVLVGTLSSATALAISEFAAKEKIPFLITGAKSEKLIGEKGNKYTFLIDESTEMVGRAVATVLAKKPYTKYWMAGDDFEFGHSLNDAVWNHIKQLNPKAQLIGQTWWKLGETDFGPYITQMESAKPDFIMIGCSGATVIAFQKAAKATGLDKTIPFYQHTAIDTVILAAVGNEGPEGVVGTANYMFYYPQTPENKAFTEAYQKLYNKQPSMPSFYGYTAGQFVAKAFQKAGKVDKEKFVSSLEGAVLDTTAVGKVEMRACDHRTMLPTYVGYTKKVPEYKDFLIGTNMVLVPAKDSAPSCDEMKKVRK
jgi:branched-chain amino acid transport system substrate-binding protein